jgi:hypothetical protein
LVYLQKIIKCLALYQDLIKHEQKPPMTEEQIGAVVDILQHIKKHPQAKHNVEGIAKYWIYQQRLEEKLDIVMQAIDFLLHEGFLRKLTNQDGTSFFSVNESKISKIQQKINELRHC